MSEELDNELLLGDVPGLTEQDLGLIAESIERFGLGEHPTADSRSVSFFRVAYAQACVAKANNGLGGDPRVLGPLADRLLAAVRRPR